MSNKTANLDTMAKTVVSLPTGEFEALTWCDSEGCIGVSAWDASLHRRWVGRGNDLVAAIADCARRIVMAP